VFEHLVDAYPNDVQLVYRHFPLTQIHTHAQKASESAEAANAQGAFWEYHTTLYESQADWANLSANEARDYFIGIAEDLSLDVEQFTADYDNGTFADYVSGLEQEAINIGLPGTPAVILDGQLIAGQDLPFDANVWSGFIESQIQVKSLSDRQYDEAPPMTIDPDKSYFAHFLMENGDEFTIELLPQSAPVTVNNFVFLANEGWFDEVTFHRVLEGFMAQTGDPTGTGAGGPGYAIDNEIDPDLTHGEVGMVSMANSGPNTNGSQFFITLAADAGHLDGSYSIFGKVSEGMDAVENITLRDPNNPNAPDGDMIVSVTIEEK